MNPFWTYKKIPEIAALPKDQQAQAWKNILKGVNKLPKVRIAAILNIIIVVTFVNVVVSLLGELCNLSPVILGAIGGGLGGYFGSCVYFSSIRKHMQPFIDEYFASGITSTKN